MDKFHFITHFDHTSEIVQGRPESGTAFYISAGYDTKEDLIKAYDISPEPCIACGALYTNQHNTSPFCFHCDYWNGYIDHPDGIRINGSHYIDSGMSESGKGFLGHGGRMFTIKMFDGTMIKTNNLWSQGPIPEHYRDRLPDNATFVTIPKPVGHRQGYLGSN